MSAQKNILVLYTELAYYTLKCFSELASTYNVNIHILRLPVNKNAPFEFDDLDKGLVFYNANEFDLLKLNNLYSEINPSLIYCAGWSNPLYLEFSRSKHKECKTLLGFDTKWQGTFRQILGSIYARIKISPYFTYAFVPGKPQADLAIKMGFKRQQIKLGAYSADVDFFKTVYENKSYSGKILMFTGRYAPEKGIKELCDVFVDLKSKGELKDWQLWCVGTGDFVIPNHPEIKDFGFQQPAKLVELMRQATVFVLPSTFEPWALVVHEFAAAGFPLICSNEVGSIELFLDHNKNGFVFKAGNKIQLSKYIQKMCNLNPESLQDMGKISYALAHNITPQLWAVSFYKLLL